MQRVTITLDDDLLETLDSLSQRRGYNNRSEAIRDILRSALAQEATQQHGTQGFAVLSYVYEHEKRDLASRIVSTQHHHHDLSVATLHVHINHDDCLEIAVQFILKNRRANLHIFNSTSRDMYEQHLMQLCRYVVETFLKREFDARRICPEDREALVMGYASQAFGLFISWLDGGLKEDFHQKLSRLCELRHGSIEAALSRCRTQ